MQSAVAPATLTAVSALARRPDCWEKPLQMLCTGCPSGQDENVVASVSHRKPLFDLLVSFFARVEALCVQVLHKSPESS